VTDEEPEELDPEDRAGFMAAWGLKEGEMTDEQILMAIKLGHY
jgi:hypothetical protein